jgi:UDP-galactopyranose mutase
VKRFSEWVPYYHKVIGRIKDTYFPIPVNIDTVNTLLNAELKTEEDMKEWLAQNTIPTTDPKNSEEVALSRVGPVLYEKIFKEYTFKQWAKYPEELDASVLERIPVRTNYDPHYFSDKFQALPAEGYTQFVQNMLDHPLITYALNTEYCHSMRVDYDSVFYTGPIDHYFTGLPPLEYRSIRFETEYVDVDEFQPNSVVNYPSNDESFTRIVEYKHFYKAAFQPINKALKPCTTIVREYTVADGDPYYPVPTQKNKEAYEQYRKKALEEKDVYFVGRLANYKYYNMDAAILNAMEIAESVLNTTLL